MRPVDVTIDKLKPGTSGHNLVVKVISCDIEISKIRSDGSRIRIAEARCRPALCAIQITCLPRCSSATRLAASSSRHGTVSPHSIYVTERGRSPPLFSWGPLSALLGSAAQIELCAIGTNIELRNAKIDMFQVAPLLRA